MNNKHNIAEPGKPRRRWYQFRLRTLLILVVLLAVPCAYVGWQAKIANRRKGWLGAHPEPIENREAIFERENIGKREQSPGIVRRWLGDDLHHYISVERSDRNAARELFPEAHLVILGQHVAETN